MATVFVPYATRWGHPRTRALKGHPKRQARRERAYARGAPRPQKELTKWADAREAAQ